MKTVQDGSIAGQGTISSHLPACDTLLSNAGGVRDQNWSDDAELVKDIGVILPSLLLLATQQQHNFNKTAQKLYICSTDPITERGRHTNTLPHPDKHS